MLHRYAEMNPEITGMDDGIHQLLTHDTYVDMMNCTQRHIGNEVNEYTLLTMTVIKSLFSQVNRYQNVKQKRVRKIKDGKMI